jgi:hypothetical protein
MEVFHPQITKQDLEPDNIPPRSKIASYHPSKFPTHLSPSSLFLTLAHASLPLQLARSCGWGAPRLGMYRHAVTWSSGWAAHDVWMITQIITQIISFFRSHQHIQERTLTVHLVKSGSQHSHWHVGPNGYVVFLVPTCQWRRGRKWTHWNGYRQSHMEKRWGIEEWNEWWQEQGCRGSDLQLRPLVWRFWWPSGRPSWSRRLGVPESPWNPRNVARGQPVGEWLS